MISLLVVDDDPPIRRLLERVAKRAGFDVQSARDGVHALEMLAQKHYQIAIVDLMMPRLSGYELVQRISRLNPRPTVIVATAMGNSDVATLDDSMIRRVIRKPFDIDALTKALVEMAAELADQKQQAATPGVTVAPPEVVPVPPQVTIAPPEIATLAVTSPVKEANGGTGEVADGNAVDKSENKADDKVTELPPATDELSC